MTDYADWTKNLIADIRANGRPTSGYFEGRPVMVLTTTGAKTGKPREAVVTYLARWRRLRRGRVEERRTR